jgi:outer membrane protein assembly factor BamB
MLDQPSRTALRLWPGVAAVLLQWFGRFALPVLWPDGTVYGVIAGVVLGLVVVLWWLFFSRAQAAERWGGLLVIVLTLAATRPLLHVSVRTGGMGMLFWFYAIPTVCLALVAWAVATRNLPDTPRRVAMVAAILAGSLSWALVRTGGVTGNIDSDFHWRWSPTAEERLVAQADEPPPPPPPASPSPSAVPSPVAAAAATPAPSPTPEPTIEPAQWPGFRGPDRDGVVRGTRIGTDWTTAPPKELWRRAVGPGWSSFAVAGNRIYTQEQRGEDEIVSAYDLRTGKPLWGHRDAARFWESNAGAGPRATPALGHGRVYAHGATGIVNALDARDGRLIWKRNAASDTGSKLPGWGYASSPLVIDDLVVVASAGTLVAYDAATGQPRWKGPPGGGGYSSPHRTTAGGSPQVVLLSGTGATSLSPADGKALWTHALPSGTRIVQPNQTPDGDLLVHDGDSSELRRLAVSQGSGGWSVQERWATRSLKPYFSDFVVHEAHAYGFDGRLISCVDLATGERKWKGGRYGDGQLVLLADQDLLLILSEEGEVALVQATPDQFTEVTRFRALDGKTWNHPVVVGDVLLVRNAEEMAAFRLP